MLWLNRWRILRLVVVHRTMPESMIEALVKSVVDFHSKHASCEPGSQDKPRAGGVLKRVDEMNVAHSWRMKSFAASFASFAVRRSHFAGQLSGSHWLVSPLTSSADPQSSAYVAVDMRLRFSR